MLRTYWRILGMRGGKSGDYEFVDVVWRPAMIVENSGVSAAARGFLAVSGKAQDIFIVCGEELGDAVQY